MSADRNASQPDLSGSTLNGLSRRDFLKRAGWTAGATSLLIPGSGLLPMLAEAAPAKRRPKIAIVMTKFSFRLHAHLFVENCIGPYIFRGKLTDPGIDVVAFFTDQMGKDDMTRDVSREYNIPIYESIDRALCRGGRELAVDGVLIVGEHGNYPLNKLGQRLYPRKRFFDEVVAVMKRAQRYVPVFSDKHLSYRWDWAKEMYDTSRELEFPFMAGSSVPLAERIPPIEIPAGTDMTEAVSIHDGPPESYDIHGLEVLQSLIEFRKGGETGVARVQFLDADDLWKGAKEGHWWTKLAEEAMVAELGEKARRLEQFKSPSHGILLEHNDGFRSAVLRLGASGGFRFNFACSVKGEAKPRATAINNGPWNNRVLFKALSHAVQYMFIHNKQPYAIERTLLTTGVTESAMHSRHQGNTWLETPHLKVAYKPIEFRHLRENGESWKILTEDTPQPKGVERVQLNWPKG